MTTTLQDCLALDAADPLRGLRAQFNIPAGMDHHTALAHRTYRELLMMWGENC